MANWLLRSERSFPAAANGPIMWSLRENSFDYILALTLRFLMDGVTHKHDGIKKLGKEGVMWRDLK